MKATKRQCLPILLFVSASTAYSQPESSEMGSPIGGLILLIILGMGLVAFIKRSFEDPLWAIRQLAAVIAAFSFLVLPLIIGLKFDAGYWMGLIWISSWVFAYKLAKIISGVRNQASEDQ